MKITTVYIIVFGIASFMCFYYLINRIKRAYP